MRSFFLVVLVVASVSVSEQRKCTGTYFETGDKAGNGRDRPPAGTPCKGGCIEEGGRWGDNYCDTEDGNWGSECVDCPEPMCTGGFFETSAGNGAARPPPGTPCAKPCAPLSGRWGENFCYTQDKAGKYGSDGEWDGSGEPQWGAPCLPCSAVDVALSAAAAQIMETMASVDEFGPAEI